MEQKCPPAAGVQGLPSQSSPEVVTAPPQEWAAATGEGQEALAQEPPHPVYTWTQSSQDGTTVPSWEAEGTPVLSAPTATVGSKRASRCWKRASDKGKEKEERQILRETEATRKEGGTCGCGRSLQDPGLLQLATSQASRASPRGSLLQGGTTKVHLI